jgi:subtilisin family serine protease
LFRCLLSVLVLFVVLVQPAAAADQLVMPYLVVGHSSVAVKAVRGAGGKVVASYPQIGVVVAYSRDSRFATRVRRTRGLEVGATRTTKIPVSFFAPRKDVTFTGGGSPPGVPSEGTAWNTTVVGTGTGSSRVTVGVLDTGVDDTHPDLAVDTRKSVSCVSGWADRSYGAWRPTLDGHGTHVAGTIAAARNGIGVVGVAPGVRLASVKLAERDDNETAESMICGFMWAASHGFQVVNNSYVSIPWRFNCPNQADQALILKAVGRAVAYAQKRDVLVVASAGNEGIDLNNRKVDGESPTDGTPPTRDIDNSCLRLPSDFPGVLRVSAVDSHLSLGGFSNWGLGRISVAAPGVDVWSTWPGGGYRRLSGTSMAAPHAAGVAALIAGEHPAWNAKHLTKALSASATPTPCPDSVCTTSGDQTSFYGHGIVKVS